MNFALITSNYPFNAKPYYGVFVQELARQFALSNIRCNIIRPLRLTETLFHKLPSYLEYDRFVDSNPIQIRAPRYFSVSARDILFFNTYFLSRYFYYKAVEKAFLSIKPKPHIIYGHFLYPSGAIAVRIAKKMRMPSVVVASDSQLSYYFDFIDPKKIIHDFEDVSGIIAVSQKYKKICVEKINIPEEKIRVFPNSIDQTKFYPRNRLEMRKKFGLPQDKFIVAFLGHFIERKGPDRILKAVAGYNDIGVLLIGDGKLNLESPNILLKKYMNHELIPEILSAADIFVLPTQSEGSCNSILEAMACGLPVVTSDIQENDDIIDNNVAIRVGPNNITGIRSAILKLKERKQLRNKMSKNAFLKSAQFDIGKRAKNILEWIKEINDKHSN